MLGYKDNWDYVDYDEHITNILDSYILLQLLKLLEPMTDDDVETQIANMEGKNMGFFDLKTKEKE